MFSKDYAGLFQIKYGHTNKPTILKAYICYFMHLAAIAVHLELVSDLTTEAFIAVLHEVRQRYRLIRGKSNSLGDHPAPPFVFEIPAYEDIALVQVKNTRDYAPTAL